MSYLKNLMYYPDAEGAITPGIPDDSVDPKETPETPEPEEATETEEAPVVEKIREALQDWANKDQEDQDFDDTRV